MSSVRLYIIVEGQTEEAFVKKVLINHLASFDVFATVRCVTTSRDKRRVYRGGVASYEKVKRDIITLLREEKGAEVRFTTMLDLYALSTNFPGFAEAKKCFDPYQRVNLLESALGKDINDHRFVPYIQLHEFETLILANPDKIKTLYFDADKAIEQLSKLLAQKRGNAELINDGAETAPSKRLTSLIKGYNKVWGADIAHSIGLDYLKEHCKHFADWLERLERLSQEL